jgi:hypothetical protein
MVALYGLWTVGVFLVPLIVIIFFTFAAECRETRLLNKDLNDKNLIDVDQYGASSTKKMVQSRVSELIREQKPEINLGIRASISSSVNTISKQTRVEDERKKDKATLKECYTEIIGTLFYGMFSPNMNFASKIEAELESNHSYCAIFFSKKIGYDRWLLTCKLCTCLNVSLMLIFALFHVQMPANDNSCYEHKTSDECLKRTSLFDPSVRLCHWHEWIEFPMLSGCSYNDHESAYTYRALITITFVVSVIMAPIISVVEYAFDVIIMAPKYSAANALLIPGYQDEDDAKLELNMRIAARVKLLRENLHSYRNELDFRGDIERLNLFDSEWGVYQCEEGEDELLFIDKIVAIMKQSITKYNRELVYFEKLQSVTRGLYMLFHFAMDLFGANTPTARIFEKKSDPQFHHMSPVSFPVKALVAFMVLSLNLIAIVVPIVIAEGHILYWVNAVIESCVAYVLLDIFFVEGGKFMLLHVAIPHQFREHAKYAYKTMMIALDKMCDGMEAAVANSSIDANIRNEISFSGQAVNNSIAAAAAAAAAADDFSVTDYMYESVALARSFPAQVESAVVLSHRSDMPGLMGVHWRGDFYANLFNGVTADSMQAKDSHESKFKLVTAHDSENISSSNLAGDISLNKHGVRISIFVHIWRSCVKLAITIYARFPVYSVRFLLHLLLPCITGGFVGLIWLLIKTVSAAIYVLVFLVLLIGTSAILYHSSYSAVSAKVGVPHPVDNDDSKEKGNTADLVERAAPTTTEIGQVNQKLSNIGPTMEEFMEEQRRQVAPNANRPAFDGLLSTPQSGQSRSRSQSRTNQKSTDSLKQLSNPDRELRGGNRFRTISQVTETPPSSTQSDATNNSNNVVSWNTARAAPLVAFREESPMPLNNLANISRSSTGGKNQYMSPLERELEKLERHADGHLSRQSDSVFAGVTPKSLPVKRMFDSPVPSEHSEDEDASNGNNRRSPVPPSHPMIADASRQYSFRKPLTSHKTVVATSNYDVNARNVPSPLIHARNENSNGRSVSNVKHFDPPTALSSVPTSLEEIQRMKEHLANLEAQMRTQTRQETDDADDEDDNGKQVTIRVATPPRHRNLQVSSARKSLQPHRLVVGPSSRSSSATSHDKLSSVDPTDTNKKDETDRSLIVSSNREDLLSTSGKLVADHAVTVKSTVTASRNWLGICDVPESTSAATNADDSTSLKDLYTQLRTANDVESFDQAGENTTVSIDSEVRSSRRAVFGDGKVASVRKHGVSGLTEDYDTL